MPYETPPEDFKSEVVLYHAYGGFRLARNIGKPHEAKMAREENITPDEAMQVAEFVGPETIELVRLAVEADRERAAREYEGAQKRQRDADDGVTQAYSKLTEAERTAKRLCPPDEPQREETSS